MMAARFRSVTWVAIALVPALGCYLVTQYVAAERAELARVERQIGQSRKAIRDLETELGTRGSMAQIERWNTQTLALAAPTATQFIDANVQLASLTALPRPAVPAPAIAVAPAAPAAVVEVRAAAYAPSTPAATPAPKAQVREASFRAAGRAIAAIEAEPQPLLRQANYTKPARDAARVAPGRVAMADGPLDAGTLADIGRIARNERGGRRR